MSGFNPNASEWKPSPAARTWTPGTTPAPANTSEEPTAAVAPPTPATVVSISSSTVPSLGKSAAHSNGEERTEDQQQMDESDPLWIAVMKVAQGDRTKAKQMIANPDSLMQYPEVSAILEADWETNDVDDVDVDLVARQVESKLNVAENVGGDEGDNMQANTHESSQDVDMKDVQRDHVHEEDDDHDDDEDDDDDDDDDDRSNRREEKIIVGDPREHVNLVFIGHVDAGKSTLSGNILYLTDNVDKRTIERYEREAKELNRDSWFLAFIMDTNEEERAKGKTVEVGRAQFDTRAKRYTILDAPGHKNYVPNMIMGASQADVGILVISARRGEFETGFERGGQTREHAMLAKTLGVSFLIVVINKMDDSTVQWDKKRFDECVAKLKPFLKSCGYIIKREVKFIPISGLMGHNVKDAVVSSVCPWWKTLCANGENNTNESTLLGLLDALEMKERDATAPVRIPVLDRYNDRGTIAMGKVESGTIRPGARVILMPTRNEYKVDALWANEIPVSAARPGENVLVKLGGGCGLEDVQKGYVLCTKPACRAVTKMICDVAVLDLPDNAKIFTAGFSCIFHAHTCEEECAITKLFETTNSKGITDKKAQFAKVGMRIKCMIEVPRTVPVETYSNGPFLGRFTLRTEGKTIGIGKIVKLPPKRD